MSNEAKEALASNGESPEDQELAKALATWPLDKPIPLAKAPSIYRERFESLQALYSTEEVRTAEEFKRHLREKVHTTLKEYMAELPYLPRVVGSTGECLLALFLEPIDSKIVIDLYNEGSISRDEYYSCLACTIDIDSIKYLISKNPYALTWPPLSQHRKENWTTFQQYITYEARHMCPLIPWIIENHGGFLCIDDKPQHHQLFTLCTRAYTLDRGIVQRFYELFPHALQQRGFMTPRNGRIATSGYGYGDLPVHIAARWRSLDQPNCDLFRWLLQHTSFENVQSQKDKSGLTLWQIVAHPLSITIPDANILLDATSTNQLLFTPEELEPVVSWLVFKGLEDRDECKLLVRLLRRMYLSKHLLDEDTTLKDPHVRQILQTLDQQHQMSMNSIAIKRVHRMISKALQLDKGAGKDLEKVNEVYNEWATKHLAAIVKKQNHISELDIPKIRTQINIPGINDDVEG